jgi:opacity protein-like surface antigen
MKKIFIILFITVLVTASVNGQFTKLGGGVALTSTYHYNNESGFEHRSGFFGPHIIGIYEFNLPFHIAPSISYIIPLVHKLTLINEYEEKTTIPALMIDVNGHYVFNSLDKFEFYGLLGIDVMLTRIKFVDIYPGAPTIKSIDKDNAIGLNIGGGTYMKISEKFDLYAEIKYLLSKYDQIMLNVGVLLNLQWLSQHEEPGVFGSIYSGR